jgi:hypothetical protein
MSQSITNISLVAAFSAGLLSFVSPCVLPLVPSYISYITGLSIEQLTDSTVRSKFKKTIVVNTLKNNTSWWHPMHLHGFSFRVLTRNGIPSDAPGMTLCWWSPMKLRTSPSSQTIRATGCYIVMYRSPGERHDGRDPCQLTSYHIV